MFSLLPHCDTRFNLKNTAFKKRCIQKHCFFTRESIHFSFHWIEEINYYHNHNFNYDSSLFGDNQMIFQTVAKTFPQRINRGINDWIHMRFTWDKMPSRVSEKHAKSKLNKTIPWSKWRITWRQQKLFLRCQHVDEWWSTLRFNAIIREKTPWHYGCNKMPTEEIGENPEIQHEWQEFKWRINEELKELQTHAILLKDRKRNSAKRLMQRRISNFYF